MAEILDRVSSLFKIVPPFIGALFSRQSPAHRDASDLPGSTREMDEPNSKPIGPAGGDAGAVVCAVPSGKARHYRDDDFLPTRPEPLDYDDMELNPPVNYHKRYNSQDGYHLVIHGSDYNSRKSETNTASTFSSHETFEQAREGIDPELHALPSKRKRDANLDKGLQYSSKKPRKAKDDRSDRLCLQCGNYHSTPCYVPYCSSCDLNHYLGIPCLEAMERLKKRLELHPPKTPVSSKQKSKSKMAQSPMPLRFRIENKVSPVLSDQHAPTILLDSASQSPVNKQQRGSPNKRSAPVCHECGNLHRSACRLPLCEECRVRHHPGTPCAVAGARLKERLEEEDARQARAVETIGNRDQSMLAKNNKAATALQFRRSSAPSPGRAFSPGVTPRKLKKNTRFCRDCGRYLNGPCTWPMCNKCNIKHFEHVPCWQAHQNLQNRLDTFDRGWGTSQQKVVKAKTSSPAVHSSSQRTEQVTSSSRATPAASVNFTTPANMTFNIGGDGQMSWSLDSGKTVHSGLPPSNPHFSVSVSSFPQHYDSHVHPSRQAFFSEPGQTAAPVSRPSANISSTGSEIPSYGPRSDTSQAVTHGASLKQSVDAFIADVAQGMHSNARDALGCFEDSQSTNSYLEHVRRNGSS
ncbi:hypothetical protein E4T49_05980 [Aureobasidium sp. EXF-10728]|nr:hypothetical protein E4T49_05980 [Aureobasidium sp. EXF-10728]